MLRGGSGWIFGMRRVLRPAGLVVALLILMWGTTGVLAAPDSPILPGVPPASDCVAETIDLERFRLLIESAFQGTVDVASQQPVMPEDGQLAEIDNVIWTSVACINANQPLRWLSLLSDRYLMERFGPQYPDDFAALTAIMSREPDPAAPGDMLELVAISEPEVGTDGRVMVTVSTSNAISLFEDSVSLIWTGEGWLIDAVELGMDQPRASATPQA